MATYKKSYFLELQDYIQGGSNGDLPEEQQDYLNMLRSMINLRTKYGRDGVIRFVIKNDGLPFKRARELYEEAVNLFYADDGIDRQAHRNKLYEDLLEAAMHVRRAAKTSKDLEVYGDLVAKAYKIKGLDQPDPVQVPEGMYKKPIKVYTLNTETINVPRVDRTALAARIDGIEEISQKDKTRLKRDAQIETIDFQEMYADQEEETKS